MTRDRNAAATHAAESANPQSPRARSGRSAADVVAREQRDRSLATMIEGIARGEERALEAFYAATVGRVNGLALRIVRTREAAEEVTVDVFLQVWRSAKSFDALRGGPIAWLLTICRSRALDYLRRAEPAEPHADPESLAGARDSATSDDPLDILAACEGHGNLHRALDALTPLQRQLIALAFFRGLTHQEIAAHARLPLGSVKTYIRRALAQMHADLGAPH